MKKFLLSLFAILATCSIAMAEVVTFDFASNDYGLERSSSSYLESGTEIKSGAVNISLNKTGTNGWRLWTDGLRVFKSSGSSMVITSNQDIESVEFTLAKTGVIQGYTVDNGTETSLSKTTFTITPKAKSVNVAFNVKGNGDFTTIKITLADENRIPVTLSFDHYNDNLDLGSDFNNAPILSIKDNNGQDVTNAYQHVVYSSDNEELLKVASNGVFIANTNVIGKATVTAKLSDNPNFVSNDIVSYSLTVTDPNAPKADILTMSDVTSNDYVQSNYVNEKPSGIKYIISARNQNGDLQMRDPVNGFVTYENNTGLIISSIEIDWGTQNTTDSSRGLDVYISNQPFTSMTIPADLKVYESPTCAKNVTVSFPDGYSYVAVVAKGKAVWVSKFTVVWKQGSSEPIKETVANVTFNPENNSELYGDDTVSLSCDTEGATIWFSIDEEDGQYTEYTAPISFTEDTACTIYAYATKDGMNQSATTSADYYYFIEKPKEKCANVVFTPGEEAEIYADETVSLTCATPNAKIWYSIGEDGPIEYTAPISFKGLTETDDVITIEAYATADGFDDGDVLSVSYYYHPKYTCKPVVFKPGNGATLYGNQTVTLSCETEGATIYIVTDEDFVEYTEPIAFTKDGVYTITALSSKEGWDDSNEISATYTYYVEKNATHYVLVNSADEVEIGVNYVFGHNSVANSGDICQWVMGSQKGAASKDRRSAIEAQYEDNAIYSLPVGTSILQFVESGNESFPYQIAIDGGYLAASDKDNNNCIYTTFDATDAASFCKISFTGNDVTVTFNKVNTAKDNKSFFLGAYYTGGGAGKPGTVSDPYFNYYINAQRSVQLYREVNSPKDAVVSGVEPDDDNKVDLNQKKATVVLTAAANHDLYYKHVVHGGAAKAPALDHSGYSLAENGTIELDVDKNSTLSFYTVANGIKSQTKSIEFHNDSTTSISEFGVGADNSEEWYDLSGRRVKAPANGIFIKKHGNAVTKHMVK